MSTNTLEIGRDWPEDFALENGNYLNRCVTCEQVFTGYKRRFQCKRCAVEAKARWDALTPQQQAEETEACAKAMHKFFHMQKHEHGKPTRTGRY